MGFASAERLHPPISQWLLHCHLLPPQHARTPREHTGLQGSGPHPSSAHGHGAPTQPPLPAPQLLALGAQVFADALSQFLSKENAESKQTGTLGDLGSADGQ